MPRLNLEVSVPCMARPSGQRSKNSTCTSLNDMDRCLPVPQPEPPAGGFSSLSAAGRKHLARPKHVLCPHWMLLMYLFCGLQVQIPVARLDAGVAAKTGNSNETLSRRDTPRWLCWVVSRYSRSSVLYPYRFANLSGRNRSDMCRTSTPTEPMRVWPTPAPPQEPLVGIVSAVECHEENGTSNGAGSSRAGA